MVTPSQPPDASTDHTGISVPRESSPSSWTMSFTPKDSWTLISQGAEARIWKIPDFVIVDSSSGTSERKHHGDRADPVQCITAIAKERFPKSYRHPKLDERLTAQRCRAEARILTKCYQRNVVQVPRVLKVDPPVLYLEYLPYSTLRQYVDDAFTANPEAAGIGSSLLARRQTVAAELAKLIGWAISKLHYAMGLIHGDLTTSNILVNPNPPPTPISAKESVQSEALQLVFIDFGLAKSTESAEERAVDLYVLERALTSTHPQLPDDFFSQVLGAYLEAAATACPSTDLPSSKASPSASTTVSLRCTKAAQATLTRLEQVRQRGRKRECFG